jgi:hemolysin III
MDHTTARMALGRMQNPVRGLLNGVAALLSAVGAAALCARGGGDLPQQSALLTFGLSLVCLYTVSSLYHSVPWSQIWKQRFQRIDHSMIYVLIAGTYTPIAAIVLDGWLRWAALGTVWGIAAAGTALKTFSPRLGHRFSVSLQILQGWLAVPLLVPLSQRLPWSALSLLLLGGLLYSVGVVVYATRRPRLWPHVFSYHEVFHVFVVAGSATHYAMTFTYVASFGLA